ncbi:MAG: single-stranded DNA-binding protein [Neisseriaceae bacterium]|nr:single-stranded DNA-binding protein [Neisseriaceae bacterium]
MAYLNKTILMGNLGCNPDVGYFADNTPRCRFTIATKKTWKDPNGNSQEKTTWHSVVFTGDIVTRYIEPYIGIGDLVEGEINNYTFIRKDNGATQSVSEIVGQKIQLVIKRGNKSDTADAQETQEDNDDDDMPY